jgi:hypothetical protein
VTLVITVDTPPPSRDRNACAAEQRVGFFRACRFSADVVPTLGYASDLRHGGFDLLPPSAPGREPGAGRRGRSSTTRATPAVPADPRRTIFRRVADLPIVPWPGSFGEPMGVADLPILPLPGSTGESTLWVVPMSGVAVEAIIAIVAVAHSSATPDGGRFPPTAVIVTSHEIVATIAILTIRLLRRTGALLGGSGNAQSVAPPAPAAARPADAGNALMSGPRGAAGGGPPIGLATAVGRGRHRPSQRAPSRRGVRFFMAAMVGA